MTQGNKVVWLDSYDISCQENESMATDERPSDSQCGTLVGSTNEKLQFGGITFVPKKP
jgi:hypothetical protein